MNPSLKPLVSILIVTWNRREELARAIQSALNQSYPHKEIIVVDNHSNDGTADMVAQSFPQIRLERSEENLGCPSGRNLGFSYCQGKYIYMLDDDGWLHENALESSVQRAESDPSIGVVMSRIHEMAKDQLVGKRPINLESPVFLNAFSGGCSLIRKDVLQKVGHFPEDFFRQAEENDLALRMLEAGYFCFLEPTSVMFHAPSVLGRNTSANTYYTLRNTNRTGLRLWPFPWCALRPLVNFWHAVRLMVPMQDITLPARVLGQLLADLPRLLRQRMPVATDTFRLFRRLEKYPSPNHPRAQ